MENFHVNLELDGQVAALNMAGDLTHTAEQKLNAAYEKASNAKAHRLILNFEDVEYINSAGMSVVITMLTSAQEAGQELRAHGLSAHFKKIFDMVGLLKYIKHFDSSAEAWEGANVHRREQ